MPLDGFPADSEARDHVPEGKAMTQINDDAPQLLGPGGEPMGPSGTGDGAPTEASATQEDTGADAVVPEGPAFHVSAVLAVPPQVTMATLIAMMNHDPMEAYKRRLEAARPDFEQSRDVLIAAAEARFMSQAPEGDPDMYGAAAMRYVEQAFMAELWDMCFETVSGSQVSIIFASAVRPKRDILDQFSFRCDVATASGKRCKNDAFL